MPPGILAPPLAPQFFDNNGDPLHGGQIFWYLAGTSTPSPAYSDSALSAPLPNPVLLSKPGGRAPQMYLDAALSYKEVLLTETGVPVWTVDNISAPNGQNPMVTVPSAGAIYNVAVMSAPIVDVVFTNPTDIAVTGFVGGMPGQLLVLRSSGAGNVALYHLNANSVGTDQLNNISTTMVSTLVKGAAIYQRGLTGQGWNMITFDQGGTLPWTPTLMFNNLTTGITYGQQTGWYVQHNRTVSGGFRIDLTSKGTATGPAALSGLPAVDVAPAASSGMLAHYCASFTGIGTGGITGYIAGAGIPLLAWAAAGVVSLQDTNFTNSSVLIGTFRMEVN